MQMCVRACIERVCDGGAFARGARFDVRVDIAGAALVQRVDALEQTVSIRASLDLGGLLAVETRWRPFLHDQRATHPALPMRPLLSPRPLLLGSGVRDSQHFIHSALLLSFLHARACNQPSTSRIFRPLPTVRSSTTTIAISCSVTSINSSSSSSMSTNIIIAITAIVAITTINAAAAANTAAVPSPPTLFPRQHPPAPVCTPCRVCTDASAPVLPPCRLSHSPAYALPSSLAHTPDHVNSGSPASITSTIAIALAANDIVTVVYDKVLFPHAITSPVAFVPALLAVPVAVSVTVALALGLAVALELAVAVALRLLHVEPVEQLGRRVALERVEHLQHAPLLLHLVDVREELDRNGTRRLEVD
eukprot:3036716-Pleurochrysis_carterae.AAC.1